MNRTTTRTTRTAKTRGTFLVLTKAQIKQLQNTRKLIMALHNNLQTGIRKLAKKTTSRTQAITCLQSTQKALTKVARNGLKTLKKVTKTANGRKGH